MFFKMHTEYTIVSVSKWMAHTTRSEVTITGYDTVFKRCLCRRNGTRKQFLVDPDRELARQLIFAGHRLPFLLDSETGSFIGNALFNFVTDQPAELRSFILRNCLNPSEENFRKILYSPSDMPAAIEWTKVKLFASV
jgi:hypothetical protein